MAKKRGKRRSPGATRRQSSKKRENTLPPSMRGKALATKEVSPRRRRALATMRRPADELPAKTDELRDIFKGAEKELALEHKLEPKSTLAPEDLGCKDYAGLVERMAGFLASRRTRATTTGGFARSVTRGFQHVVNGELLEWLVCANRALLADLKRWGRFQIEHLNDLSLTTVSLTGKALEARAAKLVDALGNDVRVEGRFKGLRVATDVWIDNGKGYKKFVDLLLMTEEHSVEGNPLGRYSMATQTEVKMPTAAKEGPVQMGAAIPRLNHSAKVKMIVDGREVELTPAKLIFSTASINQSLVRAQKPAFGVPGNVRAIKAYDADTGIEMKVSPHGAGVTYLHVPLTIDPTPIIKVTAVFMRRLGVLIKQK